MRPIGPLSQCDGPVLIVDIQTDHDVGSICRLPPKYDLALSEQSDLSR